APAVLKRKKRAFQYNPCRVAIERIERADLARVHREIAELVRISSTGKSLRILYSNHGVKYVPRLDIGIRLLVDLTVHSLLARFPRIETAAGKPVDAFAVPNDQKT